MCLKLETLLIDYMGSVEPIELMLTEPRKVKYVIQFRMYVSKYVKYGKLSVEFLIEY